MSAPRILILTASPLCRNPRVLKEATALGQAGFATTVMTVANVRAFEDLDADLLLSAPFKKIAVDHLSPHWRARFSRDTSRLATELARQAAACFGWQSPRALGPCRALARMALRFPADLTIVHTELPFCIGTRLLARGRRVAADFEDWHSHDLLPEARKTRPLRLLLDTERTLLHRCAYTSTTSHVLARSLHATFGGNEPIVITNSFPLQPAPPPRDPSAPPSLFWFSQTIGPGRGLEPFLHGWALTAVPSRLVLLGQPVPGYLDTLHTLLPPSHRARLEILDVVPPAQLPALIARHHIGLALESATPENRNCSITNKILQYLNAGLAILASDTAAQREVFSHAPGAGEIIPLGRPGELAAALDRLLSAPAQIAAMGAAARRAAETHYSWEHEAPKLVSTVGRILFPDHRGPHVQQPPATANNLSHPLLARLVQYALAVPTLGASLLPSFRRLLRSSSRRAIRTFLLLRSRPYSPTAGTILVITPHPDDESLGCGGLIASRRAAGQQVNVLFITNGAASHPGHPVLPRGHLAQLRRHEASSAMGILGVPTGRCHFLDIEDGVLGSLSEPERKLCVSALRRHLDEIRPSEIFIPFRTDGSSEHDACFALFQTALRGSAHRPRLYEYPVWSWWNPLRLWPVCRGSHLIWRFHFPDRLAAKQKAIDAYQTQTAPVAPWTQPVLPKGFRQAFDTSEEFFFER